jgi:amylosucrase
VPGVPDSIVAASLDALEGLPAHRRATFRARLERWWPDLHDAVAVLHPGDATAVAGRLVVLAAQGYAERPDDLHALDERRLLRPDWIQQPDRFGYACYVDRFAGDLAGMARRLDHLEDLGVTYLHLMPLLQPREGDNDGGYAVQDYRAVRSDLGTVDDLRDLATALRARGISLVVDLVLNHVAREHAWAAAARAGDPTYRRYFHVFDERTGPAGPDAYERTLPEVFPELAPGSFTFDDELGAWVWTTFNSWQWDLDWSNADVLAEFAELVLHLANLGVEVLRLDAIAFLWKRLGTDCQNQPEVHAVTQALRTVGRLGAPATLFKAEAIVGPRDLVAYLGTGRHTGRVSDLAYHNSLMVQVWSMLAAGDTVLARHALAALPPTPPTGTWITYLRCHDDIGWAIDDGDAAAVGLGGAAHRHFLSDYYAGTFPGSPAEGLVFEENAVTGDRRISGTAASLTGLGAARRDPAAAVDRILLGHAVVAGWVACPSCGAATSWRCPTTRTGPPSPATSGTTAGRTAPASPTSSPRAATTRPPRPAGSSPASPTSPGCAPACPSCTPPPPSRCCPTPTRRCSASCGATPRASWSASTTSPASPGPCRGGGCSTPGCARRTTRSPASCSRPTTRGWCGSRRTPPAGSWRPTVPEGLRARSGRGLRGGLGHLDAPRAGPLEHGRASAAGAHRAAQPRVAEQPAVRRLVPAAGGTGAGQGRGAERGRVAAYVAPLGAAGRGDQAPRVARRDRRGKHPRPQFGAAPGPRAAILVRDVGDARRELRAVAVVVGADVVRLAAEGGRDRRGRDEVAERRPRDGQP